MLESDVRQRLTRIGKPVDGRSIEAKSDDGVPDWNCVTGWIEIKKIDGWPTREHTRLRIPHPKRVKKQAIWALRRWRAGGKAHLLLVVGEAWLILDAPTFFDLAMNGLTRSELEDRAVRHWSRLDEAEMLDFLEEVRTP